MFYSEENKLSIVKNNIPSLEEDVLETIEAFKLRRVMRSIYLKRIDQKLRKYYQIENNENFDRIDLALDDSGPEFEKCIENLCKVFLKEINNIFNTVKEKVYDN